MKNKHNRSAYIFTLCIFFSVILGKAYPVTADIYLWIDNEGVLHFTNRPTTKDYDLFMKERSIVKKLSIRDNKRFDEILTIAAKAHGIPFSLLKAVVRVESGFNPKAVSKKGALGLMQIMPQNLKALKVLNPFDPKENIMGGARYLKSMLKRFNNNTQLALAAYNAGPKAVDKYNDIPPYEETEKYVRLVLKYYHAYKNG